MALALLPESKQRAVGDSSGPGSKASARSRWQTEQMRMMVLQRWHRAVFIDTVEMCADGTSRRRPGGKSPEDDLIPGYYLSTRWKSLTFLDHFEARNGPPSCPLHSPRIPPRILSHAALPCRFLPPISTFFAKAPRAGQPRIHGLLADGGREPQRGPEGVPGLLRPQAGSSGKEGAAGRRGRRGRVKGQGHRVSVFFCFVCRFRVQGTRSGARV